MTKDPTVGPMTDDLILWRCLHDGPVNALNLENPKPNPDVDWPFVKSRNIPLLHKLTRTYGACAMLARDKEDIVATLRFYPKALCAFGDYGAGFCLQQRPPYGPSLDVAASGFPPLATLSDKTLFVHCLFVAAPPDAPDRYRRQGLATRLAARLVSWASERGWSAIEATSYEELPKLYAISGVAGRRFWQKLGFRVVAQDTEPAMTGELLEALRREAEEAGLKPEDAANRYRMRLELP